MKKDEKKRYLVSYSDEKTDFSSASTILGVAKTKVKEGVSFLESDAVPGKDDIMHFENVGITSIELSEDEAEALKLKDGVASVEEDVEMHILELGDEDSFAGDFSGELLAEAEKPEPHELTFNDGYDQAMLDVFASILQRNRAGSYSFESSMDLPGPIPKPIPVPFPPLPRQPVPWNISLVRAPQAWARGINGSGIKVAVLDTGIAAHRDLVISGGVSFVPGVVSYNDGHSHGTHCAGIIGARNNFFGVVGVAPLCSLYAVKVLSDAGSGSSSWIIAGMEWCIRNKMNVISMSLGGMSAPMLAYANAVKRCQDNRITVVIASGNSYGSSFPWVCSPANSFVPGGGNERPIAVGSVNQACVISPSSSRGGQNAIWNQVTVVAPGVSINSTVLANGYGLKSGTSMACPHVAGEAALIYQRFPGIIPPVVKRRIAGTARDLGPAGYDITYGFGLINCDLATR